MLLSISSVSAFTGSGSGTDVDPYQITTPDQLDEMRNNLSAHYILVNDIDMNIAPYNTGAGFEPVGTSGEPFTGSLNGDGFTISNLFINRPSSSNVGLFGYLQSGASIVNVQLLNVDITAQSNTGSLVGVLASSSIENSSSTGIVTGSTTAIGGLVGFVANGGSIDYSFSTVDVSSSGSANVGGLVGQTILSATFRNSYAGGDINAPSASNVGGLIGSAVSTTTIENSYSTGNVVGSTNVGGFIGLSNAATITGSFWDNQTSGQSISDGGVGLPTALMTQFGEFQEAGWDFDNTWGLNASVNERYPFLLWQGFGSEEPVFAGGNGTTANPYRISSCQQLQNMNTNLNAHYVLVSDVDCNVAPFNTTPGFEPVGTSGTPFTGSLDGQNFTINNLLIDLSTTRVGLFGETLNAQITNLSLTNANVSGDILTGTLIGDAHSTNISNVQVSGFVYANRAGGMVGFLGTNSVIEYSSSSVSVEGTGNTFGSLVGEVSTNSIVNNSFATGNVIGGDTVGGLVGIVDNSVIENSYFSGHIEGTNTIGGLIGNIIESRVINSYSAGSLNSSSSGAGGFVGIIENSVVENSYSEVNVNSTSNYVGGFASSIENSNISSSYATGDVIGTENVGGFVGEIRNSNITLSYATGDVTGINRVGGFVGETVTGVIVITQSYSTGDVTGNDNVGGFIGSGRISTSGELILNQTFATGDVVGLDYVGGFGGELNYDAGPIIIIDSYALGDVTANNNTGGFSGYIYNVNISNSFSIGLVTNLSGSEVGGFVGSTDPVDVSNISNSFWDNQTSNQSTSIGEGVGNLTGLPTADMTNPFTFFNGGWDFTDIWGYNAQENNGYPFLRFQDLTSVNLSSPQFTQTPSISGTTTNSATLTWRTENQATNYTLTLDGTQVSNSSAFNTSLQSFTFTGLSASTSYDFNLTVCNEGNFCTSFDNSFTTSAASSGGSSGGGGGGGSTVTPQQQTYIFTAAQTQAGRSQNLRVDDVLEFNARHSSNNNTNRHTLTVNQFNSASARATIRSTPQEVILPFNQNVEVDVDGDGVNDIVVRYTGFTNNEAQIFIQEIQRVEESQSTTSEEESGSSSSQSQVSAEVTSTEEESSIVESTASQDSIQDNFIQDSTQLEVEEITVVEEVEIASSTNPLVLIVVSLIILVGIAIGAVLFLLKK